jgi:hypothetical protein
MSLCSGLLWLTLNLALIIQCLSGNNIIFQFRIPCKMFLRNPKMSSLTPGGTLNHCPRLSLLFESSLNHAHTIISKRGRQLIQVQLYYYIFCLGCSRHVDFQCFSPFCTSVRNSVEYLTTAPSSEHY